MAKKAKQQAAEPATPQFAGTKIALVKKAGSDDVIPREVNQQQLESLISTHGADAVTLQD